MSRIDTILTELRENGQKGLMPFVCAGHPPSDQPGQLGEILAAIERGGGGGGGDGGGGVCIAEIGIPFSDPIADGPVIAAAMHEAIEHGTTPRSVFDDVRSARDRVNLGLVAMVSISIVHRMNASGVSFVAEAKSAGFDGLIVPDLPVEESDDIRSEAEREGLTLSLLVSPTTPARRAERIVAASTGFVYLLARAGITGEQDSAPKIGKRVSRLREMTDLPIACGFGISSAEHVREVVHHADAAIVGSALVRRLARADDPPAEAERFVAQLAEGLRSPAKA